MNINPLAATDRNLSGFEAICPECGMILRNTLRSSLEIDAEQHADWHVKNVRSRNPFETLRENPFAADENQGADWANPRIFASEAEYVAYLDEQMAVAAAARDERDHEGRVS